MKYDVEYFKQSAFRTLAGLFPTTLEDWDRRDSSQIQYFYGLPFAVVKLCRDTGLNTLLPAALCSACFTLDGVSDILNGRISSKHRHRAELYHADKIICLKARETLHNALRQLLLMTLLRRAVSCPSPERCNPARLESLHSLIESKMMRDSPQHIFHVKFQTLLRFHAGVCAACLSASEMSFEAARANLWSELPSFFSLPSWQELRKSLQTHGLEEPSSSNRVWESPWKGTGERYDAVSEITSTYYLNRKAPAKPQRFGVVDVIESRLGFIPWTNHPSAIPSWTHFYSRRSEGRDMGLDSGLTDQLHSIGAHSTSNCLSVDRHRHPRHPGTEVLPFWGKASVNCEANTGR